MDCSLSTWPSISQYDDFLWSGLGDLVQYDNLDRTKVDASVPESSRALCNAVIQDMDFQQDSDFYEPSPPVDLDAVLGSTMSERVPCAPVDEDDEFQICFGHMLIQSQKQIEERMNIFIADPISSSAAANAVNHVDSCEYMCFADNPMQAEDGLRDVDPSMMDPFDPAPNQTCELAVPKTDMELQTEGISRSEDAVRAGSLRLRSDPCSLSCPVRLKADNTLDRIEELQTSTLQSVQTGPGLPWAVREMGTAVLDSAKHVGSLAEHGDRGSHEQIRSQQLLALSSEVEMKKTQDSRARRLAASKRRSKKYPLQKLIRMSSSTSSTREKIGNASEQRVCSAASPILKDVGCLSKHDALAQSHIVRTTKPLQNPLERLDESELEQLQNILQKMNTELRLEIRDAFFRLAKSAKLRQTASTTDASSSESSVYEMEAQTNPVDRWIANLLFSKA